MMKPITVKPVRWYKNPYLLLTLTALFWSGNFVLARAIHAVIPPMTLSFWRWVIALLLLLPFVAHALKPQWPLLKAQWGRVVLLALTGISGFNSLVYLGTQYTNATNALLINAFIPVLTILISWFFLHMLMGRRQFFGVAISVVGVMVILSRGDWQVFTALSFNRGDLLIFVAAISWALYTVWMKGLNSQINRLVLLWSIILIGIIGILPFYLWEWMHTPPLVITNDVIASFAYVGIFPSVLAVWFYNYGVAEVGPARASLFIHLMPVFGTLMSIGFLGESFYLYHVVGISAIFSGIYLSTRKV
ncbi:MAG: DMT family transporter [Gammaproteobacteria bacterium]|nr:DMT family transporter [Gammaproteobacteria bacterium]